MSALRSTLAGIGRGLSGTGAVAVNYLPPVGFRISVDTGGTFTDVVVADADGVLHVAKAPTDLGRAFQSIEEALSGLAPALGLTVPELLARTDVFTYGTTRATNAIVEGKTARTAFF